MEKAIQLVERNALHDLGYNWQDRDGSIVFYLRLVTIFQDWSDIFTLMESSNGIWVVLRITLKRLQRGLAIATAASFRALA